jgi:hypothetical protein
MGLLENTASPQSQLRACLPVATVWTHLMKYQNVVANLET